MATIGLPVFEKFGGEGFLFGPLAAEWRTTGDEEFSSPWRKWSSITPWNLVEVKSAKFWYISSRREVL